jgi:hypothetical protein
VRLLDELLGPAYDRVDDPRLGGRFARSVVGSSTISDRDPPVDHGDLCDGRAAAIQQSPPRPEMRLARPDSLEPEDLDIDSGRSSGRAAGP